MSKQDFAEFHKLLALLKYECVSDLYEPSISDTYRDDLSKQIEAIDILMQVCRVEKEEATPLY